MGPYRGPRSEGQGSAMGSHRRWNELSDREKTAALVAVSVQLSLAATAWADLAFRPARQVRGPKGVWAAVIAINYVGPIAYFVRGVQRELPHAR